MDREKRIDRAEMAANIENYADLVSTIELVTYQPPAEEPLNSMINRPSSLFPLLTSKIRTNTRW